MPLEQVNIGAADNDPNADTLRAAFEKVNALVGATNQAINDLAALVVEVNGKAPAAHSHSWDQITGKPSTFAPSAHGHAIGDVTGLQGALDGKAPAASGWTLEQLQDAVAAMFQGGTHTNAAVVYDDATGVLSISASGPGATVGREEVEDFVGGLVTNGTGINVVYDDAANRLSISLAGEVYSTAEKNKLAGIAAGATANATDAELRDRATHTGEQPISSVTGLQSALAGKAAAAGWAGLTFDAGGRPVLTPQAAKPSPSPAGLLLYARQRAGMLMPEVQRPNGRDITLQAHLGMNRIGMWNPVSGTSVSVLGMPRATTGTTSTPSISSASLATSCRRWRMSTAATAGSGASDRVNTAVCWRGNAPGLGGFLFVTRISLSAVTPDSGGAFGIHSSSGAFTTVDIRAISGGFCGIGFKLGTDVNWQVVSTPNGGATTLFDCGPDFPVADLDAVLSLYIFAAQNDSAITVRLVNEVTGAVFEKVLEGASVLPQNNLMMAFKQHIDNGATAAVASFDCYGVYLETDF